MPHESDRLKMRMTTPLEAQIVYVVSAQQRKCLRGEHEARVICECGGRDDYVSHLHQVETMPVCRHCRCLYVAK